MCYSGGDHATAATTGRYAGRKATAYAKGAASPVIDRAQVDQEKDRVYAPIHRSDGLGWKEVKAGLARVMQDCCGEYKSNDVLRIGLKWFDSIRESEIKKLYARNPHELAHCMECYWHLEAGELVMHNSLARKASNTVLEFKSLDYPEVDSPDWHKLATVQLNEGEIEYGDMPLITFSESPTQTPTEKTIKSTAALKLRCCHE